MALRTRHLSLASVFASLLLVCASGATLAASRAAVQEAGLMRSVHASTEPLASDSITAQSGPCSDFDTNGENITHILIDAECAASPSDFLITVDGEPVTEFHTDDGPCESLPRDFWFSLHGQQDTAHVCVVPPGGCPEGVQVYAKAGSTCIAGTQP
jgi:hypothetical protein